MRTAINGVPAAFFGFKGHEEEIDEIKKACCMVHWSCSRHGAWMNIADGLEDANISNVSFSVDQGVCFVRVCEKCVAKEIRGPVCEYVEQFIAHR